MDLEALHFQKKYPEICSKSLIQKMISYSQGRVKHPKIVSKNYFGKKIKNTNWIWLLSIQNQVTLNFQVQEIIANWIDEKW